MVTVEDFKNWFSRDFPYLPYWDAGKVYFAGDVVFVSPNFYQSLVDNNTAEVTDTQKWQAVKDSEDYYVSDGDIEKSLEEAKLGFNKDLFDTCEDRRIVMLYLAAYYLVVDIKNGMAGISSNAYASFVSNKSVGNVSEGYSIPTWVAGNPMYSIYLDNGYGKKYLSLILPRITGWFYLAEGDTTVG